MKYFKIIVIFITTFALFTSCDPGNGSGNFFKEKKPYLKISNRSEFKIESVEVFILDGKEETAKETLLLNTKRKLVYTATIEPNNNLPIQQINLKKWSDTGNGYLYVIVKREKNMAILFSKIATFKNYNSFEESYDNYHVIMVNLLSNKPMLDGRVVELQITRQRYNNVLNN